VEVRKVIRLKGSYLLYLPKRVASSFVSEEVNVFWEGDFVGVTPLALRRATAEVALPQVVVAGYAVGLDELELPTCAEEAAAEMAEKMGAVVEQVDGVCKLRYVDKYVDKEEVVGRMLSALRYLLDGLARGTATRSAVRAVDDETDVLRLTVNRLCTKAPTPKVRLLHPDRAPTNAPSTTSESSTPKSRPRPSGPSCGKPPRSSTRYTYTGR